MVKASKKGAGGSSARAASSRGNKTPRSEHDETGARRTKKVKPPAVGIMGVPGSKNDARRCTATANRTGERCRAPAIKGGNVCRQHGGSLPGVRKAANDRLMAMVEPAMLQLRRIIDKPDTSDADKLRGIQLVLDRTGFKPGVMIEVGLSRFDELLAGAVGIDLTTGEVSLTRDLGSAEREALLPGHSWEDVEQAVVTAQEDIDRERHNEEAREHERGRIRPDENTVRGEVVTTDEHPLFPPPTPPSRFDDIGGRDYPRRGHAPRDLDPNSPPRFDPEAE